MEAAQSLKNFLDFVDECHSLNSMAKNGISTEEKRQQDLLHAIEFEPNGKKRGPLDTKLHKCRVARRGYKDIFEVTEEVVKFFRDPQHKKTLDHMRQLLGSVRKVEEHQKNRFYIPRIKE